MKEVLVIGRAEKAKFPQISDKRIPVKIDTGAKSSSIWASTINETKEGLEVIFFGPNSEFYDGKVHLFKKSEYDITQITNSFGHEEFRYRIKLKVKVNNRLIRGTFTLSNRSAMIYPVLIGRRLLLGKFIVDVSSGRPLLKKEKEKREKLKKLIEEKKGCINENSNLI